MEIANFTTHARRLAIVVAALSLAALLAASAARAQSDSTMTPAAATGTPPDSIKSTPPAKPPAEPAANHLYDKFQIDMSLAEVLIGPNLRVDDEDDDTDGTSVDTGNILGIDRAGLESRLAVRWRPGHRHELEAGILMVNRDGERKLTKDITFRDTTFAAGLNVNTSLGASNAFLSYRFAFTAKEKTQIGAQLGLGAILFKVDINAVAGVASDNDTLATSFGTSGEFPGPTAALGLFGRFRLGEKWYLEANAGAIGASIENITVKLVEAEADVRYFINDRFGLEAGYGLTQVKIDIDKAGSGGIFDPTIQGSIKYPFQNFRIGVVAAFQ